MAIRAVSVGKVSVFTSALDKPGPEDDKDTFVPTKFQTQALDSRILGILKDKSTKVTFDPSNPDGDIGTDIKQNDFYFQVCQFGLIGADNFKDDKDADVVFATQKRNVGGTSYTLAAEEFVKRIPEAIIAEMAEFIMRDNTLTETEKNA